MVLQTSPNYNLFTKCSNAHLSKVIYKSPNIMLLCIHRCQHWSPLHCIAAALQHCTGCSHPSVACGSCRKLLITVTRAAANSDHDTIFFCWCWCSDASTDTIWFLLTSLCQGCQGIFRYTVVNSTQIVLLLLLWRSQRWTFESRPRIHNPYSKFKILWRRLSNNMKLSNNINIEQSSMYPLCMQVPSNIFSI